MGHGYSAILAPDAAWQLARSTAVGDLSGRFYRIHRGISSAGLWIGQRNLIQNNFRELRRSADSIQMCLVKGEGNPDVVQQELLLHSSMRTSLWLEKADGVLVLPESDHLAISDQTIRAAMAANQKRIVGLQQQLRLGENQYLSELVEQFPSGARLWISHEVSSNQQALSHYLGLMIVIWGSCLMITLVVVSALVRRIVQPLQQLNAATDDVTAETLTSARLTLNHGPIEVLQLGGTYNALLERLSQSWELQRQFVSTVSHELRTPLTIVQGYLHRTIRRGNNLSAGQLKGLQTAEEESIRMRRLLDDLLDLSRSDSGRLSISNEAVQLIDQLEQVVDLARSTLSRRIELNVPEQSAQDTVTVQADPARLRQVLLDLIENADKYSPNDRPIHLALRLDQEFACVDVIDEGIGIPADEQERVFERFQRASNATEKTGSGLGLSVVKLLVEGMGGTIGVSSRIDEGSCFTVRLPR